MEGAGRWRRCGPVGAAALLDKSTELSNLVALFLVGETVAAGRFARQRPQLCGARLNPCLQRPLGCRDHV